MKWQKFIQNDEKLQIEGRIQRLNTSMSIIDKSSRQLLLKSIEKSQKDSSRLKCQRKSSVSSFNNSPALQKYRSKVMNGSHLFTPLKDSSSMNHFFEDNSNDKEKEDISQLIDKFGKDLEEFIKRFLDKLNTDKYKKQLKEQINKKIVSTVQNIVGRYTNDQLLIQSQQYGLNHKAISCKEQSSQQFSKLSLKPQYSMPVQNKQENGSQKKKKNRVLQFKQERIQQKNSFNKIQQSMNVLNNIFQNKRESKIDKTSRVKLDKSNDSSIEDLRQNSLSNSRQTYKSRLKSKDALYNINKILHG